MKIGEFEAKLKEANKLKDDGVAMQKIVWGQLREIGRAPSKEKINSLLSLLILILAADYDLRRSFLIANAPANIQTITSETFIKWIRENRGGIVTELVNAMDKQLRGQKITL